MASRAKPMDGPRCSTTEPPSSSCLFRLRREATLRTFCRGPSEKGRTAPLDPYDRHVDEMLGDEPDLQLVRSEDVAHQQVVGAVVAVVRRFLDGLAHFFDDDLVSLEQAGQHGGGLLDARLWGGGGGGVCCADPGPGWGLCQPRRS